MDVRSEGSVEDAVKWVKTEWGKIDVLVNNAGIGMRTVRALIISFVTTNACRSCSKLPRDRNWQSAIFL
ncbi:SDR family NAD(P)-dependent oxidoreductase [Bacillus sp. FJAT-26390]|uniref:SDR family NAD(P)-dependent oxidoreductase n=1 Tax=Bacillus sp. FJAT-26390 TaxID=1743142 RepID=UPI0021003588|nr:SDR family NAD(P)-dependent oxidoreductase [Bacillus sp. FJAT-26390]